MHFSTVIFSLSALMMSTKSNLCATTREPNLLKNLPNGRYYGRFTNAGKQKWVNLDSDISIVAKIAICLEEGRPG